MVFWLLDVLQFLVPVGKAFYYESLNPQNPFIDYVYFTFNNFSTEEPFDLNYPNHSRNLFVKKSKIFFGFQSFLKYLLIHIFWFEYRFGPNLVNMRLWIIRFGR